MTFDTLAVVIIMNSESNNLPLDVIQRIHQCARDVTSNFTLEKVSVINLNKNVIQFEIEHNLQQYEIILLITSFQQAATVIFNTLCCVYNEQLVDLQDTYYRFIGGIDYKLQVPYNTKILSVDNSAAIFCIKQVYIISIDCDNYLNSIDYFIKTAFRTMRRFVKELYLSEEVVNGDLSSNSCYCGEGEITVSEKRISIIGNTIKAVNDMELDLDIKLRKIVCKRSFVDKYMEKIIESDEPHVKEALAIITHCFTEYHPENVFLCFNGGKDCTVLLHLLLCVLRYKFQTYTSPITCLYIEHRNPFPEIRAFVHEIAQYYNLKVITERQGIKDSLGNMLKYYKGRMKGCLMGTRRTDPFSEHLNHFHMTDPDWPQVMRISPLLNWNYGQIWQYLRSYQVPYCDLYDRGYTSLGNVVNTVPNPALQYRNIHENEITYMPAYKLRDGSLERNGRVTNVANVS